MLDNLSISYDIYVKYMFISQRKDMYLFVTYRYIC